MTVSTQERINVKSLIIKEQIAPDFKFDPESALTEEEWDILIGKIQYSVDNEVFMEGIYLSCFYLKLLSPKRFNRLNFSDEYWQENKEYILNLPVYEDFSDGVIGIKMLFPEKVAELDRYPSIRQIISTMSIARRTKRWETFGQLAFRATLLFQDFETPRLNHEEINSVNNTLNYYLEKGDIYDFCEMAANYKMVAPDVVRNISIPKIEWPSAEVWPNFVSPDWNSEKVHHFLSQGVNLLILSADKVEVTEDGLVLSTKTSITHQDALLPLPTQRRF